MGADGSGERLLFLVNMLDGVPVTSDVLGTSWEVANAPSPCTVFLPRPPDDYDGMWDLARPPVKAAEAALEWFETRLRDDWDWWGRGSEGNSVRREVTVAVVQWAAVVTAPHPSADQRDQIAHADRITEAVERWLSMVGAWLEVLAELVLAPAGMRTPDRSRPRYVYPLPLLVDEDGRLRSHPAITQVVAGSSADRGANRHHWDRAVAHANAARLPPEEHVLLRDGRAAWWRQDRRKAVIDAATAAEVAMATAVRERLASTADEPASDQVLRNVRGAVELLDLATALGCSFPVSRGSVMNELAVRRNEAVHAGVEPTIDETRRALDVARAVVHAVSVLP